MEAALAVTEGVADARDLTTRARRESPDRQSQRGLDTVRSVPECVNNSEQIGWMMEVGIWTEGGR